MEENQNKIKGYGNPSFDYKTDCLCTKTNCKSKDFSLKTNLTTNSPKTLNQNKSANCSKNGLVCFLENFVNGRRPSKTLPRFVSTTNQDLPMESFQNSRNEMLVKSKPTFYKETNQFFSLPSIMKSEQNMDLKCIIASRKFDYALSQPSYLVSMNKRATSLREYSQRKDPDKHFGDLELEAEVIESFCTIGASSEENRNMTRLLHKSLRRSSSSKFCPPLRDDRPYVNTNNSPNIESPKGNNICPENLEFLSLKDSAIGENQLASSDSKTLESELKYLRKTFEDYALSLSELLLEYDKLKATSSERIKQQFDRPFELIKTILKLQCKINEVIQKPQTDFTKLAQVFLSHEFKAYEQYMIIFPSLYANIFQYKNYFEPKFSFFKYSILLPASRLNIYVQILQNLLKYAWPSDWNELNVSIQYLNDLKRNANMKLTLNIVKDSPIDLHLEGEIIHMGELHYVSGPLPKKTYYLIAFKNLLLITISKVSSLHYVTHYRSELIANIGRRKNLDTIILSTLSYNGISVEHCLRCSSTEQIEKWLNIVEEWIWDVASYELKDKSIPLCLTSYSRGKNVPLSLWQVFPFLKELFSSENNDKEILNKTNIDDMCSVLISKEKDYVVKLSSIFNSETLPPPPELRDILLGILNLHEIYFLPALQDAQKKASLIIDVFVAYIKRLSAYRTYLVQRSLCTTHMPDGARAHYYILPIQHLAHYVAWATELRAMPAFQDASDLAVNILLSYIRDAKVMLLHQAIPNCYLDFYKTGDPVKGGYVELKIRPRQKNVRDGNYLLLLFQNALLVLKTITPTYQLVQDLWVNQLNFGPPSTKANAFNLEYRQGGVKPHLAVEIKTGDESSKQIWVNHLKNELHSRANEIKKFYVSQSKDTIVS